MNTETGWGDFNRREFGAGCRFKSLGNVRQKGEVDARRELDNDMAYATDVTSGEDAGTLLAVGIHKNWHKPKWIGYLGPETHRCES